jgi:uncharacterized protein
MSSLIFVNLPVRDLARSTAFYESLGAEKNPNFSNQNAAMMVFSDTIHVMLLTHDFFRTFTTKRIADARTTCQVLLCLSAESREEVDALVDKAGAAGSVLDPTPKQDFGLMYGRSFEDLDGHIWEIMWMDAAAAEQGSAACSQANAA